MESGIGMFGLKALEVEKYGRSGRPNMKKGQVRPVDLVHHRILVLVSILERSWSGALLNLEQVAVRSIPTVEIVVSYLTI